MTGNTFAGETCVYCCVAPSTSDDHVFARKFFLERRRDKLPQVPACDPCNGAKAALEGELLIVLPFGGRHADARENLARLAAGRVSKNLRAARTLQRGRATPWVREGDVWLRGMSVPLDWEKVETLFVYVAKGLAWHHWKVRLDADCFVEAHSLLGSVGATLRHLHRLNAKQRVRANLGEGTFVYEGAQAADNPLITSWEFSIYGGMISEHRGGTRTDIGAITGPVRICDSAVHTSAMLREWRQGVRLHASTARG